MSDDSDPTSRSLAVRGRHSLALRRSNSLVTRGLPDIARFGNRARIKNSSTWAKSIITTNTITARPSRITRRPSGLIRNSPRRTPPGSSLPIQHGQVRRRDRRLHGSNPYRPENAPAYGTRGRAYLFKDDYDQAIADCTEAIRLDPAFSEAYDVRAAAYKYIAANDQAIADYTALILLNPDAYWHRCRGDFYREMADYDKAIADYTEAIRLAHYIELKLKGTYEGKLRGTNEHLLAYRNRGRAYLFKDDYDQAIADFTEAIQIDPEFSAAHCPRRCLS